jgi:hypothetical protein
MNTAIGAPRFPIIVRPTSRNVEAVIALIDRLKLTHVPQRSTSLLRGCGGFEREA